MRAMRRSIVIAAGGLIAVSAWLSLGGTPRPAPRIVPSAAPAARPVPAPVARDLLAGGLSLSPSQRQQLGALAARWEEESAVLEAGVRAAEANFDRFAASARAVGRTSLAEVQEQSAEWRELSAELRARRRLHSESALAVLTDAQRRQLPTTAGGAR